MRDWRIAQAADGARSGRHVNESGLDSHVFRLKRWTTKSATSKTSPVNRFDYARRQIGGLDDAIEKHEWLKLAASTAPKRRCGRLFLRR